MTRTTPTAPAPAVGAAPASLSASQLDAAQQHLATLAGANAVLRADQKRAIATLLQPGARALVVQATGWGKSAVYWITTALLRTAGHGPTLVISPLLSLMRDQVVAAERAGLRAATVNSANVADWEVIESRLRANELDVLLISPERLANPSFGARVLDSLVGELGLLVIDEAHAISDWGHDFRPDYRRLARAIADLHPQTPVLATTATANARVTQDVAAQLGSVTVVLRGPLARSSLELAVIDGLTPVQRYAWVVENLPHLPGSGIIYALTVADAERLAAAITAFHGAAVAVASYTGQLSADERQRREDLLRDNQVKALIATSALGMGYDKPDLGFVVHVGAPPSPVSYYQQVGRAGRAVERASVFLLSSRADEGIWDYFATATIPQPAQLEQLLEVVPTSEAAASSVVALEAESGLRRSKVDLLLKQLAVDGIVQRTINGWYRTDQPWVYDQAHYDAVLAIRKREAAIMRQYVRSQRCLMQLLQESLDDPEAAPCGRCQVCTGVLPEDVAAIPAADTVREVSRTLRQQQHLVDPRKMWPGGAFGTRGRIPVTEQAEVGRAIIFADAPEWQELVAAVFDGSDNPPPAELADAAIATLVAWREHWPARPSVVLGLPAAGFNVLTAGMVDHIANAGRLDNAGLLTARPLEVDPTHLPLSSPAEAAHWARYMSLPQPEAVAHAVVLLVVDATASLWPITVAASMIRSAGATAVLPLIVHRQP